MLVYVINVRGQSPFGDGANITKRIHIKSEESANHVIFPCMYKSRIGKDVSVQKSRGRKDLGSSVSGIYFYYGIRSTYLKHLFFMRSETFPLSRSIDNVISQLVYSLFKPLLRLASRTCLCICPFIWAGTRIVFFLFPSVRTTAFFSFQRKNLLHDLFLIIVRSL